MRTIRINKSKLNEKIIERNKGAMMKETAKTITFQIFIDPHQKRLSDAQIKRNWFRWIY